MRAILRILFVFLIISVPLISIVGSANLVSRTPDLYTFEFNNNQTMRTLGVSVEEREMSEFFSGYLMGKEKTFSYVAYYQGKEQDIFNIYDGIIMEHTRDFLNFSMIWLAAALILFIIGIILFRYMDLKRELRMTYKFSWILYAVFWLSIALAVSVPTWNSWLLKRIEADFASSDSLLLAMITPEFLTHWMLAVMGISLVFMIIIGYLIWKLSKPKMMFW